MDQIVLRKLQLPKMYQINIHLTNYKKKKFGATTISITYLSELLKEFTKNAESVDSPYVVHDLSSDNKYFRFFMTSTALIEKARGAHSLQADATYKLMWQGFPVLIVGTTDLDRKFHLIGVAVCVCEKQEDFEFVFNSVKKCARELLQCDVTPTTIVCDAAHAISNAFKTEFGAESTVIMCWAHMLRKVKQKLKTLIKEKELFDMVIKDIVSMQVISSPSNFEIARSLFKNKYESQTEFLIYFNMEWVTKNPNWYEGAMQHTPSTNNSLEATNRVIKDQFTLRERLFLGEFVTVLEQMIGQFSRRCKTDLKFSIEPTISAKVWTSTYEWLNLNPVLPKKHKSNGDVTIEIVSTAGIKTPILSSKWTNFDEYIKYYMSKWQVTKMSGDKRWLKSLCSCPFKKKKFICKHVVGISVRMAEVFIPENAKNVIIPGKRKPGRTAKAKKALILQ